MKLSSSAFRSGEPIPAAYTADGRNVSPPLEWHESPEGVRGFALVCDDPDAPRGTFTHWVIFNMPAKLHELQEGAVPGSAVQGNNDFGKVGYGGPSPPPGRPHHYHFRL